MDEELKAEARLALRNAYYSQFSALVLAFEKAVEGLESRSEHPDTYTDQMQEMTSVYGIDRDATPAKGPEVRAKLQGHGRAVKMESLCKALQNKLTLSIWVDSELVFVRNADGKWECR